MPNWCEQDLYVSTDEEENWRDGLPSVKKFKEFAQGESWQDGIDVVLDHNKFIPYPEEFRTKDDPDEGFNRGGYEWCIRSWGAKWGICRPSLEDEDLEYGYLAYSFESAWSPAKPLILKMSEMFPKLIFDLRWFEMGMAVHGKYRVMAGAVLEDVEGDYYGRRGG